MPTETDRTWLIATEQAFRTHKVMAEKAAAQMDDDAFARRPGPTFNSVAVVMRHIAGNLLSRWTDFLASDGEKPTRDRDAEFADWPGTRAELMAYWESGWGALLDALAKLSDADAGRTTTIRGEPHTAAQAIERSLAHTAYHVGQITLLARLYGEEEWQWITIAPGGSRAYNAATWGTAASRGVAGAGEAESGRA